MSFQHALFRHCLICSNLTLFIVAVSVCCMSQPLAAVFLLRCFISIAFISLHRQQWSTRIQINTSPTADVFNMMALSCGLFFVLYLAEGVLPFSVPPS